MIWVTHLKVLTKGFVLSLFAVFVFFSFLVNATTTKTVNFAEWFESLTWKCWQRASNVVHVNFIHEWRNLQFKVYLLSEFLPEICWEEVTLEIFLHIFVLMSDLGFTGLTSNKPTPSSATICINIPHALFSTGSSALSLSNMCPYRWTAFFLYIEVLRPNRALIT